MTCNFNTLAPSIDINVTVSSTIHGVQKGCRNENFKIPYCHDAIMIRSTECAGKLNPLDSITCHISKSASIVRYEFMHTARIVYYAICMHIAFDRVYENRARYLLSNCSYSITSNSFFSFFYRIPTNLHEISINASKQWD